MIGQQDLLLSSGSGLLILDQSSSIDIPDISPLKSTPSRVVINENLNQISLFESFNTEDDFKLSKTRRKPGSLRRHPYQGNPSQFIPSFKKDSRSSQNLLPPKPPPTFSNRIFEDSLDRDKSILSTSAISSEAESDTPQKPVFNKSATPKIDQTTPTQLRPWQRDFKKKQAKVCVYCK